MQKTLLLLKNLDKDQLSFYKKYEKDRNFVKILSYKALYEIPHTLDYLRLVEQETGENKMRGFFKNIVAERKKVLKEAGEIKNCFTTENKWSHKLFPVNKKHLTTPNDIKTIEKLCRVLARTDDDASAILVSFFKQLVKYKKLVPENYLKKIPDNWYSEPWYYTYVQYFGADEEGIGTFETLKNQLNYLEEIGIKNIYILPHYQSPNADAGYDISDYKPSEELGGEKKFGEFMEQAEKKGFRVATDLVFNNTSTEHKWFLKALKGESKYFDYYLKCPDSWKSLDVNKIIRDEKGDLFLYLPEKDENGKTVISKRILIFPDNDKTLWVRKKVEKLDKEVLFYREFWPFQTADLDLQNPHVTDELFNFLGQEISTGILGKRIDAIAHWIKKPGTDAKDLPETYALQMLIKQFLKHLSSKTIILPEVVTTSLKLKGYAGEETEINGHKTTTGGDALFDFQLQQMLREMIYFEDTTPFWTRVHQRGEEGVNTSVPLLPIEHHDETYMGFICDKEKMRDYIGAHGIIYKNGMSGGARYASCLNRDAGRIAVAFFCQYMMPATPVIYYGTEIGATNRYEQMHKRQKEQFATLERLLGPEYAGEGKAITFEKCEDPRELQRGPIIADEFKKALKENYPALEVIKALNSLRKKYPAMRSYNFCDIHTGHHSVFGIIKFPGKDFIDEKPVVAIANISSQELTVQIPVADLKNKLKRHEFKLKEIFKRGDIEIYGQGEDLRVSLSPYSSVLLV